MNSFQALKKAINFVGGQTALARLCKVRQQTVHCWLKKYRRVPAERVIQIEKVCKGHVRREELRPDLYPPNEEQLNE